MDKPVIKGYNGLREDNAISGQPEQPDRSIENIIAQVQGVLSSRVVCKDREIVEIHVLADSSRSPKQVVRDIESAILVKLGLPIDHKCISIAQLDRKEKQIARSLPRFKLVEIGCVAGRQEIDVFTTIALGNDRFKGTASGPNTSRNRLHLVARATLDAVINGQCISKNLNADAVHQINLSGQEIIVVFVSHHLGDREEILLGTALDKGDPLEATAKATLDAMNRRLAVIDHK